MVSIFGNKNSWRGDAGEEVIHGIYSNKLTAIKIGVALEVDNNLRMQHWYTGICKSQQKIDAYYKIVAESLKIEDIDTFMIYWNNARDEFIKDETDDDNESLWFNVFIKDYVVDADIDIPTIDPNDLKSDHNEFGKCTNI